MFLVSRFLHAKWNSAEGSPTCPDLRKDPWEEWLEKSHEYALQALARCEAAVRETGPTRFTRERGSCITGKPCSEIVTLTRSVELVRNKRLLKKPVLTIKPVLMKKKAKFLGFAVKLSPENGHRLKFARKAPGKTSDHDHPRLDSYVKMTLESNVFVGDPLVNLFKSSRIFDPKMNHLL